MLIYVFLKKWHNLSLPAACLSLTKCNITTTIILWLILDNLSVIIFKVVFISSSVFLDFYVCIISLPSESIADARSAIPYWCTRKCHCCQGRMYFSMCLVKEHSVLYTFPMLNTPASCQKLGKGRNMLALYKRGCFGWMNTNQTITFKPSFSSVFQ